MKQSGEDRYNEMLLPGGAIRTRGEDIGHPMMMTFEFKVDLPQKKFVFIIAVNEKASKDTMPVLLNAGNSAGHDTPRTFS